MNIHLGNIGTIIQLSIAPAFLLVGIGTQLRVLNNRLVRIINRSRILERRWCDAETASHQKHWVELEFLYRRLDLIHRAFSLCTCSALLVCVVIVALFVDGAFAVGLANSIAILFIFTMLSLILSFVYFLREIFVSTKTFFIFMHYRSVSK